MKKIDDWFEQRYGAIDNVIAKLTTRLDDLNEQLAVVKQDTENPDSYLDRVKLEGGISNTEKALAAANSEYRDLIESSHDEILELYHGVQNEMVTAAYQKRNSLTDQIVTKISELNKLFSKRDTYYNQSAIQFNQSIKDHVDEIPKVGPYGTPLIGDWIGTREHTKINKELIHLKGYLN